MHDTLQTSEQVYQSLRNDIAAGRLAPGERLEAERLARLLGVSRTPVRESLRLLQREGLVEIIPNHGARVRKFTLEEIRETYEVREVLEGLAVRRLVESGPTSEVIARLRKANDQRRNARTVGELELADLAFHRAILQASGSRLISDILESRFVLLSSFRLSREIILQRQFDHDEEVNDEHDTITQAIEAGDAALAERLMREHIRNGMSQLEKTMNADKTSSFVHARRGFTLVELLVVIGIIAVLLAILLPSLSKARESAFRVQCASNMRTIGQLLYLYAHDNGGTLPPSMLQQRPDGSLKYRTFGTGNTGFLGPALYPKYVEDGRIFYCPSAAGSLTYDGDMGWESPSGRQRLLAFTNPTDLGLYSSYYYNAAAKKRSTDLGEGVLKISASGQEPIMAEFIANVDKSIGGIPPNHKIFGCNMMFLDGHVEWYRDKKLSLGPPPFPSYPSWEGIWLPDTK